MPRATVQIHCLLRQVLASRSEPALSNTKKRKLSQKECSRLWQRLSKRGCLSEDSRLKPQGLSPNRPAGRAGAGCWCADPFHRSVLRQLIERVFLTRRAGDCGVLRQAAEFKILARCMSPQRSERLYAASQWRSRCGGPAGVASAPVRPLCRRHLCTCATGQC